MNAAAKRSRRGRVNRSGETGVWVCRSTGILPVSIMGVPPMDSNPYIATGKMPVVLTAGMAVLLGQAVPVLGASALVGGQGVLERALGSRLQE